MTTQTDLRTDPADPAHVEALALMDRGDYDKAESLLQGLGQPADGGRTEALLGLCCFRAERYGEAAAHYRQAVAQDPGRKDWAHMLGLATANSVAEVDQAVPPPYHFRREELLAPPPVPAVPAPLPPLRLPYMLHKLRYLRFIAGHAIGTLGTLVFDFLTQTVGRHYRGHIWTNWYQKGVHAGVLTLAYMRERLNAHNLVTTYPPGSKIGFMPRDLEPPPGVTHFRTADGSWNNLADPKEGAAHTRFMRNVHSRAIKPDDDLLHPNPRLVSQKLLTRGETMKEVGFLNMLAAAWIQFQNSDWISHGENISTATIDIPFPEDDPARERYQQSKMTIRRTQPDPTWQGPDKESAPVTFVNEVTHWWDGSQIYGSDQATQDRLRSHVGGRLKLQEDGRLPLNAQRVEDTGFNRNWWVGQAMLHNLFVREHNAICDHLKYFHPDWDDDRLFNVARLVNAAVMAKIHSVEWTPAVLPNERLAIGLNANWYGILTYKFRKARDRKTEATFNIDNPELGGLVGNAINKHMSPFGLSQEFVEIYRLHSFLPERLDLRDHRTGEPIEDVAFAATRQAGSAKLTDRVPMADLFYSFGNQHPGALELNNYPHFMRELSVPGSPVFDMGAVDILRARERGVPRYNEFRRQLGLKPIKRFEDLTDSAEQVAKLKEVYGDDVEKLDLMVGTLGEGHRPTQFGFGETMFQIFILNASRRLQADRFFTTDYREEVYTKEGMKWIDDVSLKSVILRHHPELATTGLGNIKNAFEPWDTDTRLDLERHPLRAFDPDLKANPRKGDAY
jgi:hypothetical protein